MTRPDILGQLTAQGVSVWLDDIGRERLTSGNLAGLVKDCHVRGVTSNPTIFQHAMEQGSAYDAQIAELALRGESVDEAYRMMTAYDIRWGCDVLRPIYEESSGFDGRVSFEVDARLAKDTARTIAEARRLWWLVDRPNLFIKIPATLECLPAITACLAEGISINVTLIFSLERYRQVIDAFMAGLEAAPDADLAHLGSVASFFVSRVDTEVDKRLDALGTAEAKRLRGKAAIANARLAYELFTERHNTDRWRELSARGARVQRPLWASTSTKDPSYPDTMYVDNLIAPHTVNTMPEATIHAVADHGMVAGDMVSGTYEQARATFAELEKIGISYDGVVRVLEVEGVDKFTASGDEVLAALAKQLEGAVPAA
ncbi:MAG TPA: transaldolase [Streptosporangiaceae bacterium]|nr:transaldolase [Streptosporangiaceae bacterium]